MANSKWIEVTSALEAAEAQVIKSFLEANDIKAILSQENFSNSFGLVNQQLPKIGILVSPENEKNAIKIIEDNFT